MKFIVKIDDNSFSVIEKDSATDVVVDLFKENNYSTLTFEEFCTLCADKKISEIINLYNRIQQYQFIEAIYSVQDTIYELKDNSSKQSWW